MGPSASSRPVDVDWDMLLQQLLLRQDTRCGWCGVSFYGYQARPDIHHRRLRSRGGSDGLDNTVALHHRCHLDDVHGHPAESTRRGFMVSAFGPDPVDVPLILASGRTVHVAEDHPFYV